MAITTPTGSNAIKGDSPATMPLEYPGQQYIEAALTDSAERYREDGFTISGREVKDAMESHVIGHILVQAAIEQCMDSLNDSEKNMFSTFEVRLGDPHKDIFEGGYRPASHKKGANTVEVDFRMITPFGKGGYLNMGQRMVTRRKFENVMNAQFTLVIAKEYDGINDIEARDGPLYKLIMSGDVANAMMQKYGVNLNFPSHSDAPDAIRKEVEKLIETVKTGDSTVRV